MNASQSWPSSADARKAAWSKYQADATATIDQKKREHDRQRTAMLEAHRADLASTETTLAAYEATLDQQLAADVKETLYPIAAEFVGGVRGLGSRFADAWRTLNTRAETYLGRELSMRHVTLSLLAASESPIALAGDADFWTTISRNFPSGAMSFFRVIEGQHGAASVEDALRASTIAISRTVGACTPNTDRVSIMQSFGTESGILRALAEHDRKARSAWEADRAAEHGQRLAEKASLESKRVVRAVTSASLPARAPTNHGAGSGPLRPPEPSDADPLSAA